MKGLTNAVVPLLLLVVIGVAVLIPTINNSVNTITHTVGVTNETHTPADATMRNFSFALNHVNDGINNVGAVFNGSFNYGQVSACPGSPSNSSVGNYTIQASSGNVVICWFSGGSGVNVTYSYKPTGFVSGAAATILPVIAVLIAILILFLVSQGIKG